MGCIQSKEPEPPAPAQPNRRVSAARKSKHGNGADGHKDAPAPPVPDEDPKVSPEELAESLTIQANSGDIHELYQFGKKIGEGKTHPYLQCRVANAVREARRERAASLTASPIPSQALGGTRLSTKLWSSRPTDRCEAEAAAPCGLSPTVLRAHPAWSVG